MSFEETTSVVFSLCSPFNPAQWKRWLTVESKCINRFGGPIKRLIELRVKGTSKRNLARILAISRNTVQHYLTAPAARPARSPVP